MPASRACSPSCRRELRHVLLPLFLGAELEDMVRAERGVRRERQPHRAVDRGDLLDDPDVVHVGEPGAAVDLGEDRSEETELPQLAEDFPREALRLVPLQDVGPDLVIGELPGCLADRLLLGRQNGAHLEILAREPIAATAAPTLSRSTPRRSRPPDSSGAGWRRSSIPRAPFRRRRSDRARPRVPSRDRERRTRSLPADLSFSKT